MNHGWESELMRCVDCLQKGGVLLYPTDTIWGLGCNPFDAAAMAKIFNLKGRPTEKSLVLLAASLDQVSQIVEEIPDSAISQMQASPERPLTIVYPRAREVAVAATAADGSVAIRITNDLFCSALINAFGHPITSTSANLSGESFGGSFSDIDLKIISGADYIVRWRQGEKIHASPSRIVKLLSNGNVQVIRP